LPQLLLLPLLTCLAAAAVPLLPPPNEPSPPHPTAPSSELLTEGTVFLHAPTDKSLGLYLSVAPVFLESPRGTL
jgi:hypothetical protein